MDKEKNTSVFEKMGCIPRKVKIELADTKNDNYMKNPFSIQHKTVSYSLQEAVYDSRFQRNLHGPFDNAEDAVASMLED